MFDKSYFKSLMVPVIIFTGLTSTVVGCNSKNNQEDTSMPVSTNTEKETDNKISTAYDGWNVVIITSDQHNPNVMGCAGHPIIKTPSLDRLAKEGMMLTQVYTVNPVCAPARQSMITALYPQEHGQVSNGTVFNAQNKTWAHHFKKHGYKTAVFGKVHDNNPYSETLGYDIRKSAPGKSTLVQTFRKITKSFKAYPPYSRVDENDVELYKNCKAKNEWGGAIIDDPSVVFDGAVINDSLEFIRENTKNKFFVHISISKPHPTFDSPENFYYMYDPKTIDMPKETAYNLQDNDPVAYDKLIKARMNEVNEQTLRMVKARYYGSLSWMDSNVGRVLDEIDKLGLANKTLFIYSTDHGEMLGDKGLFAKSVIYDEAARIPLLIRMPGVVPTGKKSDALISNIDYFPTIANLVGAADDLPEDISGKDFTDVLLKEEKGREYTFTVSLQDFGKQPRQIMVRSERWKFIRNTYIQDENKKYILFDMQNDPHETENLAYKTEYHEAVLEHNQAIDKFLKELKEPKYKAVSAKDLTDIDGE